MSVLLEDKFDLGNKKSNNGDNNKLLTNKIAYHCYQNGPYERLLLVRICYVTKTGWLRLGNHWCHGG